jgi:hypothetical protein
MGGNAPFSFRFSLAREGLGGNAPFFQPFLAVFSVFERQCSVFLTLFWPFFRLRLSRFLGGYAPFYPTCFGTLHLWWLFDLSYYKNYGARHLCPSNAFTLHWFNPLWA